MNLGAFSISLTVKDIGVSKAFYEKLGFEVFAGDSERGYLIMKNGEHVLGLFQSMFEKNILTFNPGWDQAAQNTESFTDVREIKKELQSRGVSLIQDGIKTAKGPGSILIEDPDGNPILIDQHR